MSSSGGYGRESGMRGLNLLSLRGFLRPLTLPSIGFVFMMLGVVVLCARGMLLRWLRRSWRPILFLICG